MNVNTTINNNSSSNNTISEKEDTDPLVTLERLVDSVKRLFRSPFAVTTNVTEYTHLLLLLKEKLLKLEEESHNVLSSNDSDISVTSLRRQINHQNFQLESLLQRLSQLQFMLNSLYEKD
jgi:hypothetical protein